MNMKMNDQLSSALTTNKLKVIAIILMLVDHFAGIFIPGNTIIYMVLKAAGRIVAPIFCFLIAEGYHHTSNVKRYFFRLVIFSLISHIPYNLAFSQPLLFPYTSVIWALTMGLAALAVLKSDKIHIVLKLAALAACCALAYTANWNFVAVLWIAGFGLFRGNLKKQIISFCVIGIVCHLTPVCLRLFINNNFNLPWHQFGIFLAIPFFIAYSGKLGVKSKIMAWSFYIFYPAHLIILYLLHKFTPLAQYMEKLFN